jgi:hypothetical protein
VRFANSTRILQRKTSRFSALPAAKSVSERHSEKTHAVNFPAGIFDVDTQEDYDRIVKGLPGMASPRP